MYFHCSSRHGLGVLLSLAGVSVSANFRIERQATAAPFSPPGAGGQPVEDPLNMQSFGAFSVLGETQSGKALFIKLPNAATLESAMTQTADELGKVFDAKPTLSGAFADAKAKNKGGVTLTAKLKGQDIQGVIFCGISPNGASSTVIFAATNAPKAEVATLSNFMPSPPIKMQTHAFPDGSGSIDLPDGWTTPNTSATHGVVAFGPAGQFVGFSNIRVIYEPNCRGVRLGKQIYETQLQTYKITLAQYQQSMAMHARFPNTLMPPGPPKPPVPPDPDPNVAAIKKNMPMRYCQYCDGPEEVIKILFPLGEDIGKRTGTPYNSIDKVIAIFPGAPNPFNPRSKSGTVYMAVTDHDGEKASHMRVVNYISTAEIEAGESWQLSMSNMRAPDETFDRDLPVMSAIMNSIKLDMNVITRQTNAETAALLKAGDDMFQQTLKRGREFQDAQAARFANHQRQIAAQEKARHDSASDFIEYIGGVRRVYDTQTGQTFNVNLFNSNAIVNSLNEGANNPNQYIQIPLRYER